MQHRATRSGKKLTFPILMQHACWCCKWCRYLYDAIAHAEIGVGQLFAASMLHQNQRCQLFCSTAAASKSEVSTFPPCVSQWPQYKTFLNPQGSPGDNFEAQMAVPASFLVPGVHSTFDHVYLEYIRAENALPVNLFSSLKLLSSAQTATTLLGLRLSRSPPLPRRASSSWAPTDHP